MAAESTAALQGQHVRRLFDHAKDAVVAFGVVAQLAGTVHRKKPANRASDDARLGVGECGG